MMHVSAARHLAGLMAHGSACARWEFQQEGLDALVAAALRAQPR
jgi:hypothetical protein